MDLSKLIPKETKFTLRQVPDAEFKMRPINLRDEIWLKDTYGEDGIKEVFENVNIQEICRIIFRLLDEESKKFFQKQDVNIIDENGEQITETLGGVQLLYSLISGWDEKIKLLNKLLENIGISRGEDMDEDSPSEDKKKVNQNHQNP